MDQTLKDLKKVVLDLMKPQIAELQKELELIKADNQRLDTHGDFMKNNREILRGFIKYKNDWVADVFLHNIDKYVLTKKQKWHLVAQHIHNKKLLEKLDVGSARQTVKQPDPFKFCSKCGYSGNVRDIVCPECHNSYFRKTEKKEYIDPDMEQLKKDGHFFLASGGDLDKILVIRDDLLKLYNIASYYRPDNEDLNKIRKRIKELYKIG